VLPITIGRLQITIQAADGTDGLELAASSDSIRLRSLSQKVVDADERVRWRFPPGGFAFECGSTALAGTLCETLSKWIQRQPETYHAYFRPYGLNPFFPERTFTDVRV